MKIHEYQAKAILAANGVPVPRGVAVTTVEDAGAAAADLGGKVVVKAQIHAGGRGKGRLVATQARTAAMYQRLEADPASTEGAVKGRRVGGVRLAASAGRPRPKRRRCWASSWSRIRPGPRASRCSGC